MINSGIVVRRTKGFYYLLIDSGEEIECKAKGLLFKDSRFDNQIAVGDKVKFRTRESDDVGLITEIEPRHSFLSRNRVGINAEQIIAANIDNLLIVVAAKKPSFRPNLINRLLVAANAGNIRPIIIVTKSDLSNEDEIDHLIHPYQVAGIEIIRSSTKTTTPTERLYQILKNQISVLSGQSGVGKSSLLNKLFPDLNIKVGAISHKTSKGSHTTTYAQMHCIANENYVIDTPGIREFGLWKVNQSNLCDYYPLLSDYSAGCKHRDCRHIHEPQCGVKDALDTGEFNAQLYQGYLDIYRSLD